jgi:hypothetical protein
LEEEWPDGRRLLPGAPPIRIHVLVLEEGDSS